MEVDVVIYDVAGKAIRRFPQGLQEKGQNLILLDLHSLSPGLYFLQVDIGGNRTINQFVKE